MTASAERPPSSPREDGKGDPLHGDPQRIGQLRGAGVQINGRKAAQAVIGLVLLTVAVLAVVFTITGIQKNQQIDELHSKGVPVTVTVSGCMGLLGGSGSNAAGYACRGSYTLSGHTYEEPLPGSVLHRPGTTVAAIAVPGDPALVSPASIVRTEHTSANVFILPAVLFVLLLGGLSGVVLWRRRHAAVPGD